MAGPLVVWTMTVDPDGAMDDWVDLPPPWRLLPLPSQELVPLLGPLRDRAGTRLAIASSRRF